MLYFRLKIVHAGLDILLLGLHIGPWTIQREEALQMDVAAQLTLPPHHPRITYTRDELDVLLRIFPKRWHTDGGTPGESVTAPAAAALSTEIFRLCRVKLQTAEKERRVDPGKSSIWNSTIWPSSFSSAGKLCCNILTSLFEANSEDEGKDLALGVPAGQSATSPRGSVP